MTPAGGGASALHEAAHAAGRPTLLATVLGADDAPARPELTELGVREVLAAPLVGSSGKLGTLVVGDRSGEVRRFSSGDLHLFATLANHAGVSLENSRLVDRLREKAAESEHQSLHDALTGLPNRTLFGQRLEESIRGSSSVAVLLLDLDRFKEVNDTLGHHNGDLLLQQVGGRLRTGLRHGDVIARLGGDEFAILLPDVEGKEAALHVANGIVNLFERPFPIGDVSVDVGVSIGIAVAPFHGQEPGTLVQRADVAMYVAKGDQSGVELYSPDRDGYSAERLALVGELRHGINNDELEVHFQPQVDLRTGTAYGAEALVRWRHPTRGLVPPDEFISIAENTGLIRPLTQLVLERSLQCCRSWRERGRPLRVSVNLSVRSLLQPNLVDDIAALLNRYGVPAGDLCLEVTESSMMVDPRRTIATLDRLRALGLTIGIDDFGTGHSALAYLLRLPVGEIKVDKSFVMAMATDRSAEAIVRTIVDLARNLDLPVVAEGVETDEVRDRLVAMGCGAAQGYLFSRPLRQEHFLRWLEEQAPAMATA
jgi:diguanylate cyclase (GGDEF)-like protein